MNLDLLHLLQVGGVVCLASVLQSAVGFGYALFATPLLLWMGLTLPMAIALVATCSVLQSILGARNLSNDVPWRVVFSAAAVRLLALIAGLAVLRHLAGFGAGQIKSIVGALLCVLVMVQLVWRPRPVQALHWSWGALAFASSGFFSGICGMGGPPLVLWSMAHDWPGKRTRGFLFGVFTTTIPVQLVLLVLAFGDMAVKGIALGLLLTPTVYLGARLGLPLGSRMNRQVLRRLAYAVLLVIGAAAVAQGFRG